MNHPQAQPDLLEQLVAACLARLPVEGPAAIAEVCRDHPHLQPDVQRLLGILDGLGLDAAEDTDAEDTVPAAPRPEPTLPRAFGRFRLLELLGAGGMGAVYLAEDPELGRRVALKLIRNDLLHDAKARSRFRREVEVLARLDHPHLCTIHEAGETDGQPWIAMRLVAGQSLREVLAEESTPVAAAGARASALGAWPRLERWLGVIEQAAGALHHAHESGLVHRDLKPGNLMLTPAGDVVVLDFGLARDESDATGLTATDDRLGTLAYMAPEQVEPRGRRVDRRTDVYALGVSLYELLTLDLPYEANTAAELGRCITAGARVAARRRVPRLPPEVDWVLDRALDVDPSRRYGTALDLAEDLRRLRQREPVVARRQSAVLRLRRWTQRNPMAAALTVALSLGLASSLVLLWRGDRALRRSEAMGMARLSASLEERQPYEALVLAYHVARLAPDVETFSQLDQALLRAPAVSRSSESPIADPLTIRLWRLRASPDAKSLLCLATRGATHEKAILVRDSEARTIEAANGVYDAAWSPDGSRFVTTSATPAIELWSAAGEHLDRIQAPADVLQARLFPDNERLLAGCGDGVTRLWASQTRTWQELGPRVSAPCSGLDLGQDGRLAVVVGSNHGFVVHDFDGEPRRGQPADGPRPDRPRADLLDRAIRVQVARGGRWFTTTTEDERVTRVFGRDGVEHQRLGGRGEPVVARLSPDGCWLLTSHVDQRARIWDLCQDQPALSQVLVGHEAVVYDGCFSPDSSLVATRSADRSVRVFEVRTGQPLAVLRGFDAEVRDIEFGPEGHEILAVDNDGVRYRHAWRSSDYPILSGTTSGVRWSFELGAGWPGSLVTGDSHREVVFWSAAGRPVARHVLDQARMNEAALAKSGRWLAVANRQQVRVFAPPFREVARFPIGSDWAQLCFGPQDRLLVLHRTAEVASRVAMVALQGDDSWQQVGEAELLQVLPPDPGRIYDLAWDPDSGVAIAGCRDGGLEVHDWAGGGLKLRHRIATGWERVSRVALSARAGRCVAASGDGRIVLFDLAGRRLTEVAGQSPRVVDLEIAPDGRHFLVTSATPGVRIYDDTGRLVTRLHPPRGMVLDARFDGRGRGVWIGSSAQSVRLAPIEPATLLRLAESRIDDRLQQLVADKYPELRRD